MKNLITILSLFALCALFSCEKTELIQPEQSVEAISTDVEMNEKRGTELEATFTTSNDLPPVFNQPNGTPATQETNTTNTPNSTGTIPVFNQPNGTTSADNPIGPVPVFNAPTGAPATQETSTTQTPATSVSLPIKFPTGIELP